MYWRYDEVVGHVELDYPRDISMWTGVPPGIDSVFRNFDGKTYFFKGRKFWEFDDTRMRVVQKSPSPSQWLITLSKVPENKNHQEAVIFVSLGGKIVGI